MSDEKWKHDEYGDDAFWKFTLAKHFIVREISFLNLVLLVSQYLRSYIKSRNEPMAFEAGDFLPWPTPLLQSDVAPSSRVKFQKDRSSRFGRLSCHQ